MNNHGATLLPGVMSGDTLMMPPNVYLDVDGDGWLAAADALRVINHLNNPFGEGESASITTVDPVSHDAAGTNAFANVNLSLVPSDSVVRPLPEASKEIRQAADGIFQRMRNWAGGVSQRVTSWIEPDQRPHRRLPETIDLPAELKAATEHELETVLTELAHDVRRHDSEEPASLTAAVDEIFQDWLG